MIFAFEGIAGAGKSTLIGEFVRRTGLPLFEDRGRHGVMSQFSTPRDWVVRGAQHDLDLASFSRVVDFVADRWILSSRVYARQRGESLSDAKTREILRVSDAVVVLLRCDPATARERLYERDGSTPKRTFGELVVDAEEMELEAAFVRREIGETRVKFIDGNRPPVEVLQETFDALRADG